MKEVSTLTEKERDKNLSNYWNNRVLENLLGIKPFNEVITTAEKDALRFLDHAEKLYHTHIEIGFRALETAMNEYHNTFPFSWSPYVDKRMDEVFNMYLPHLN